MAPTEFECNMNTVKFGHTIHVLQVSSRVLGVWEERVQAKVLQWS